MAYQTGFVGPIVYFQDNSGNNEDTDTFIEYTPQQFGAPATAQIIVGTIQQSYYVSRGTAYIHDLNLTPDAITFWVFTQAAGGFPIGHHSGAITVSTSFQWESQ